ncbi:ABC transporter ATP-binding protein [Candidatus Nomurabacteria bacterium]|nr:ABC transporter ATP-binding protein [Candidatus Nomurabacteria bacterium]
MKKQKLQKPLQLFGTLKELNSFLIPKEYRKPFFFVLVLETIVSQTWLLSAFLWSKILDLISSKTETVVSTLILLIVTYQGTSALRNFINSRKTILDNKTRKQISEHIEILLAKKYSEWEKYDKEHPDSRELIDHAHANFSDSVNVFMEQRLLLQNIITFTIALIGIMFIKWWYVVAAFVSVVPFIIFGYKKNQRNHELNKRIAENKRYQSNLKSVLSEDFSKIDGKVDLLLPKHNSGLHWIKKIDYLFFLSINKYWWVLSLLGIVTTGFVLFDLTKNMMIGLIGLGTLNLAFNYFGRISDTLFELSNSIIALMKGLSRVEEFIKFLNFTSSMKHKENVEIIPIIEKLTIEFKNVSFRYPSQKDTTWAIRNVSFKINPGERIGILGENGSGKSTIIQLLLRLYDPTEGEILINGKNLKDIDRKKYGEHFGVLEQNFTILQGMFQNVIRCEKPFDEARLLDAIQQADIYEKIMSYENKYMENYGPVFKKGVRFSGGEKQKLALASVVYRNPNIVVLDEPTSAMSPLAEKRIFEQYNKSFPTQTLILVSHRFKSLDQVNRILIFEKGTLTGDGSHQELMGINSSYKKMFLASIPKNYMIPETQMTMSIH